MKNLLFISIITLYLQSCVPLATIGMVSLGAASKEKGIGTTLNDNIIKTKISNLIFKLDKDLIKNTKIFVNNGSVLLTGKVKNPSEKVEFTKISWAIRGVNEVNNELQITDTSSIKNVARDIASMGEIRARIMTDKAINSLNFSIDVLNDNIIKTKISNLIFKLDKDLIKNTKVFVNNGSVLLTGKVKNPGEKVEFTKISWAIRGVNEVNNELQITDTSSIKNVARDIASMGEIRARIMSDKAINSINFSIDVVNDKAYISGVANSKEEMLLVKNHASSARFVKEVYNYIILFDDKR